MRSLLLILAFLSQFAFAQKIDMGIVFGSGGSGSSRSGSCGGGAVGDIKVATAHQDYLFQKQLEERDGADSAAIAAIRARIEAMPIPTVSHSHDALPTSMQSRAVLSTAVAMLNTKVLSALLEEHRDYNFRTPADSEAGKRLSESLEVRNLAVPKVPQDRRFMIRLADNGLELADSYYDSGDFESGDEANGYSLTLIDLATSWTPGVSWGRDLYEAITGYDAITGELLSSMERGFSVWGAASLGVGSKVARGIKVFSEVVTSSKVLNPQRWKESVKVAQGVNDALPSDFPMVRRVAEFLRDNKFSKEERKDFITAFTKDMKLVTTTEDMTVYRYFIPDKTYPAGKWVTKAPVRNPQRELALQLPGPYKMATWTLPKNTKVVEGTVAPRWGQPGGGHQIFLPDWQVLK